jgi:hypothetical protein
MARAQKKNPPGRMKARASVAIGAVIRPSERPEAEPFGARTPDLRFSSTDILYPLLVVKFLQYSN